jgi:hypothetical protein
MLSIYLQNTPGCLALNGGGMMMQTDNENQYLRCSREASFADNVLSPGQQPPRLYPLVAASKEQSSSTGSTGSKWYENSSNLGRNFTPGYYDVICARGKVAWNHSGNQYFRALVKEATDAYSKVDTKAGRTAIVSHIVDCIRSKGTGFVKQERGQKNGAWIEVGDLLAREKAGQMLRNALSSKYRSSISSKKRRRRDVQVKRADGLHDLMASNQHIQHSMATLNQGAFWGNLSDEELMALFAQEQCNMLAYIKANEALVDQFLQAEVSVCLILNGDDSDSDGDVQMT